MAHGWLADGSLADCLLQSAPTGVTVGGSGAGKIMPDFETGLGVLALVATAAYLLGAVPFGLVMARVFGLGDLRAIGSGNIGATNVLRTGSKTAAFLTLLLDGGKGAIAVLVARGFFGEDAAQIAGFSAFLGHLYPVWLSFKGGKGVATFFGTALALAPLVGVLAGAVWLATAAITRFSSLSALLAALAAPMLAVLTGNETAVALFLGIAGLIFLRHATNIRRLAAGTEPRIGQKKETAE